MLMLTLCSSLVRQKKNIFSNFLLRNQLYSVALMEYLEILSLTQQTGVQFLYRIIPKDLKNNFKRLKNHLQLPCLNSAFKG